jgi:TPR repeat protein
VVGCFQAIAELDHPISIDAIVNLGRCYAEGIGGLKKDLDQAEACWQRAASLEGFD